jgi:hypothetical protein
VRLPTRQLCRVGWVTTTARVAASLVLCVASVSFAVAQAPEAPAEAAFEPERSRRGQDEAGEPSFFVVPIRTDLQRRLIADGKPVRALIEINAFATIGKTGVDRMRALDILALRRSLAAIKARDPDASIVFVIGFLGVAPPDVQRDELKEHNLLAKECRDLATQAKIRITQVSGTYIGTPGVWPKIAAAAEAIDLTKETDKEAAVEDDLVRVFPVRTKVSRFLTGWCHRGNPKGADCVVYIKRPIEPKDEPLIGTDVESHIKAAVSKLDLPRKDRIDFQLRPPRGIGRRFETYLDAIHNRFLGKESQRLTNVLGFRENSVSF